MTEENYGAHVAPEPTAHVAGVAAPTLATVVADLAERAVKTFAQTLLVFLGAGATVSVLDVPWTLTIAENASTDATPALARALAESLPGVRVPDAPGPGRRRGREGRRTRRGRRGGRHPTRGRHPTGGRAVARQGTHQ